MSGTDPSRRETLAGLAALAALPTVGCVGECGGRTGAQTEGPYYPGEPEERADVTEGLAGVPLQVTLLVLTSGGCTPVADAEVDLWSADAAGDYSGYDDFGTGPQRRRRLLRGGHPVGGVRRRGHRAGRHGRARGLRAYSAVPGSPISRRARVALYAT
jgi:protocatechuate 3,4-dioxygenase beta subunit